VWDEFQPERWRGAWETRASLAKRLRFYLGDATGVASSRAASASEFMARARRFKTLESLRIAYLDVVEGMSVDQVTLQISTVADVLIEACLEHASRDVSQRHGCRPPASGLCVLALGKLGGRELNYSSDIDLNFVYDECVESLDKDDGRAVRDPLEVEAFFRRLVERFVALVSSFTAEGQLYRLDARLRPEGSAGRLVWSARAAVNYYYSAGRSWERQALLRLRPVAGDFALAERLRRELERFVYPASLTAEEVSFLRNLKVQVEKIARRRGEQETQVKIGQGGIRDVEYIVQYLQLIHGCRVAGLRGANTFEALEVLEQEALLGAEEVDVLRRGYRFLRRVEHRIQMAQFLQTHRLPEDARELERLARGLGFEDGAAFRQELARHAARIRRVYRLRFEEATARRRPDEELPALLDLPLDAVRIEGARLLEPYGFKDAHRAFERLKALSGPAGQSLGALSLVDSAHAKEVFRGLVMKLLVDIGRQPEPDRTLLNLEECVRTLGARSVFYQLLSESDAVRQLFVDICARSSFIVDVLRSHPDIFDEVVDAMLTGYRVDGESLRSALANLSSRGEAFDRELFKLKYVNLLLVAIRDLEGLENTRRTMLAVSEVAEALLGALAARAAEETAGKYGTWPAVQPRHVILGLGKLGGREMSYRSDIDIVILYEGDGVTNRGITVEEYFERFSHALLGAAKSADSQGKLLHIDVRLRPLGNHNSLAISVNAWKEYFLSGHAQNWERQAFLRARPVGGDLQLAEGVLRFLRGDLVVGGAAGPRDPAALRADVWQMRRRLEANARPGDLKRGRGGIVDAEFLVQTLQLLHGKAEPAILEPNTVDSLRKIEAAGILDPSQVLGVLNSYSFLRWIENRFALVSEHGESLGTMDEAQLDAVVQRIGYRSSGEEPALKIFRAELDYHRKVLRSALRQVLGVA
jgi:glutamate-ammonia-ligase adenylyltransferase